MNALLKKFRRVLPVQVSLLTWEWMTTYEKLPSEKELQESFEKDFPKMSSHLKNAGGRYVLWPLISFNSAEGRRFRYLVVVEENAESENKTSAGAAKGRCLPGQIWLYGVADQILRQSTSEIYNGNALLYHCENGVLTVLVFFEGRLCHWVEESGYEKGNFLQERLELLGEFLKNDSLFSRAEKFDFIKIDELILQTLSKEKMFAFAAKDHFWKGLDLGGSQKAKNDVFIRRKLIALTSLILVLAFYFVYFARAENALLLPEDELLPELSAPPVFFPSTEQSEWRESENFSHEVFRRPKKVMPSVNCDSSALGVQGMIADKLFLSAGKTYRVGDSLGHFLVQKIARDGVGFSCGGQPFWLGMK